MKVDYLSKVLNIKDPQPDGILYVERLGLNFFFIDGLLVDFQSSDGLNEWAKHFKQLNPRYFEHYVKHARMYWGNSLNKIINEVNKQFQAFSYIPGGANNQHIELHKNSNGTINFYMLMVCHYGTPITAGQLEDLNYGRYTKIKQQNL